MPLPGVLPSPERSLEERRLLDDSLLLDLLRGSVDDRRPDGSRRGGEVGRSSTASGSASSLPWVVSKDILLQSCASKNETLPVDVFHFLYEFRISGDGNLERKSAGSRKISQPLFLGCVLCAQADYGYEWRYVRH